MLDSPSALTTDTLRTATAKAMRFLVPMMMFIYFLSFIDRTNVALAKGAFQADLGITPAMYGFGAGIFFWGYTLLKSPSNLLAHRIGRRRWIARVAVTWVALSAAINTIGLLGGFVGPYVFGLVEKQTGRSASGFAVIAITALLGLLLIPILARCLRAEAASGAIIQPSHR